MMMRRRAGLPAIGLAAILALTVAACSEEPAEPAGSYTLDPESGTLVLEGEREGGSIKVTARHMEEGQTGSGEQGADGIAGWPHYPGARVISQTDAQTFGAAVEVSEAGPVATGQRVSVTLLSADKPDEIAAYYRTQAASNGYAIGEDFAAGSGHVLSGSKTSGEVFTLSILGPLPADPEEEEQGAEAQTGASDAQEAPLLQEPDGTRIAFTLTHNFP
jgi:hypothetical protein